MFHNDWECLQHNPDVFQGPAWETGHQDSTISMLKTSELINSKYKEEIMEMLMTWVDQFTLYVCAEKLH